MRKLLFAFLLLVLSAPAIAQDGKTYDRVIKSGTIRCGYAIWKPILYKDANTGALGGLVYDLVEDMAHRLDLKVEWTEDAGWNGLVEGLNSGRFDLACTGMYLTASRSREIDFSDPLFYSPMLVAVRAGEKRITKNADLDNDAYKIAVQEGEAGSIVARQRYPKAGVVTLPQLSEYTQVYEEVKTGKADATLIEAATFAAYDAANPGVLKLVEKTPVNLFPVIFTLPPRDAAFKTMINAALSEATHDGTLEKLLAKHEEFPGTLYRLSKPYELPQ